MHPTPLLTTVELHFSKQWSSISQSRGSSISQSTPITQTDNSIIYPTHPHRTVHITIHSIPSYQSIPHWMHLSSLTVSLHFTQVVASLFLVFLLTSVSLVGSVTGLGCSSPPLLFVFSFLFVLRGQRHIRRSRLRYHLTLLKNLLIQTPQLLSPS